MLKMVRLEKKITGYEKHNLTYSTNKEACQSGYRSGYKYWLSNKKMSSILESDDYKNLKFIDNFSNIIILKSEKTKEFTWKKNSRRVSYDKFFKTTDGLHWDENTTKFYMQLAFDTVKM